MDKGISSSTSRHHLWRTLALCLMATSALVQCGGKANKAKNVVVTIAPEKPIVITADAIVNYRSVKAPWFTFFVTLTNGSDEAFTIVALQAEITGTSSSGT